MTLYRKYRPSNFNTFFGNKSILQAIANAIERGKISHAYLFSGSRGTGKTSLARLIAKSINCLDRDKHNPCLKCHVCESIAKATFPDMVEIDAASNRGIEEIRSIKESVFYKPVIGKYKVYIIDEVHMLTKEAFNALLKTLEEPPKHVIFILATTEPEKLPETIHSRCQRYDMQLLSRDEFILAIGSIVKQEERLMEESVYDVIYKESSGSMRDALSLLEKILISIDGLITLEATAKVLSLVPKAMLEEFYKSFLIADMDKMVNIIDNAWMQGYKVEAFFKDFAMYLKEQRRNPYPLIDKIYSTLNEFKFEDNKRVVAYLVVNRLLQVEQAMKERVAENKQIASKQPIDIKQISENTQATDNNKQIAENIQVEDRKQVLEEERVKQELLKKSAEKKIEEATVALKIEETAKAKQDETEEKKVAEEKSAEEKVADEKVEKIETLFKKENEGVKEAEVEVKVKEDLKLGELKLDDLKSKEDLANSNEKIIEQVKLEENKKVAEFLKVSLRQVEASWPKVLELAKSRKLSLMIFLTAAKIVSVEKNILELSYESVFHKESLEKMENRIILQSILWDIFNTKFEVKITLSTNLGKLDLFLQEEAR